MNLRYYKVIVFSIMFLLCSVVHAGNSLYVACHQVGGVVLTHQYITNYNIINQLSTGGVKVNSINVHYNGLWYESHSVAASSFLSMIQMGVTLDTMMDLCVSSTSGSSIDSMKLIGIGFSYNF